MSVQDDLDFVREKLRDATLKAQAFFAAYATEARTPHCAGRDAEWIRNLLLRAEEANLYKPETK